MDPVPKFLLSARDTLKGPGLTPLQIEELEAAIKAHNECNSVDNASLQEQRAQVEHHWKSLYSTMDHRGDVLFILGQFTHSFAGLLLEEYYELTPRFRLVPMRDYFKTLGTAEERQEAADLLLKGDDSALNAFYEKTVIFAARELSLDRKYVEDRLRIAVGRGNLTQMLIRAGNQVRLREVITQDLASLQKIVAFSPQWADCQHCVDVAAKAILRQLKPTVTETTSRGAPGFWSNLWPLTGGPVARSPRLEKSFSSARSLLSDDQQVRRRV